MENAVWVIFGILAFLIGIGILISLVGEMAGNEKETINRNALREFGQWCKFVCGSDIESRLSKEIEISSGAVVSSKGNSICMEFNEWRECANCKCDVKSFDLNLNRPEILEMYKSHSFKCIFERAAGGLVSVECRG